MGFHSGECSSLTCLVADDKGRLVAREASTDEREEKKILRDDSAWGRGGGGRSGPFDRSSVRRTL